MTHRFAFDGIEPHATGYTRGAGGVIPRLFENYWKRALVVIEIAYCCAFKRRIEPAAYLLKKTLVDWSPLCFQRPNALYDDGAQLGISFSVFKCVPFGTGRPNTSFHDLISNRACAS